MNKKPLKILAINGESDPAETGAFIEMWQRGIDITVITWPNTFNFKRLKTIGVPTIPFTMNGKFSFNAIRFIRKQLKKNHYDVLHMCDKRATMNGLWASLGINIKLVAYRGIVGNVSYLDPQMWFYLLNPRIDKILCVCDAIRKNLLSLGIPGLRIKPNVPITIHKGHDPDWYPPPFVNLKELGIPENTFVVICAARGIRRKGIPILLKAIDHLPKGLDIHFLLAGTDMNNSLHKKLVSKNQYKDNIHLHNFLKRMPWILPNCNVIVLPSLRREGLPRSIIEAMIGGTVPIVTNIGGSPELVEDNISGFVVPAGKFQAISEKILFLYENQSIYKEMQKACKKRISEHFMVKETAKKLILTYHSLSRLN